MRDSVHGSPASRTESGFVYEFSHVLARGTPQNAYTMRDLLHVGPALRTESGFVWEKAGK